MWRFVGLQDSLWCIPTCIPYPISYFPYLVSCILYPISCSLYPTSHILYPVSYILHPISYFPYLVSCILYPISYILFPIPYIPYLVSCILYLHPISHSLFDTRALETFTLNPISLHSIPCTDQLLIVTLSPSPLAPLLYSLYPKP